MINTTEEDDDLTLLLNFRKNAKQVQKAKQDFKNYLEADFLAVKTALREIMSNPENLILGQMKDIDLIAGNPMMAARIQYLIKEISFEGAKEYMAFMEEKFKTIEEKLKADEEVILEKLKAFREKNHKSIPIPNDINDEIQTIDNHYRKIDALKEAFADISQEVYGDETLDTEKMFSIYFGFKKGMDIDNMESFIKEVRKLKAEAVQSVKRITINDSTVLFWFETQDAADSFYSKKSFLESIYEKWLLKTEGITYEFKWGISYGAHNTPAIPQASLVGGPVSGGGYNNNGPSITTEGLEGSEIVFGKSITTAGKLLNVFQITPKEHFESEGGLSDQHFEIKGIDEDKWGELMESIWEFDGPAEEGLAQLIALGAEHEPDLDILNAEEPD